MTRPSARHRSGPTRAESRTAVWYLSAFVLALLLIPSAVVLPGPLKSNGSPAVLLALTSFGAVALAFVAGRRTTFPAGGAGLICVAGALVLTTWASGYVRPYDADVQASILRALLGLVGYTGISLLTMLTMQRAKLRRGVTVVLVAGLTYDGVIGIIQGASSNDSRYLLNPPGFILNQMFRLPTRFGQNRATGTADSPIEYAVLMAILVALSLYLLRRENAQGTRVLGGLGFLVGVVGIPASVSRTAVVCVAAVALVYLLVSRIRDFVVVLLVVAGITATFVVAVPGRTNQLTDLFTQASSDDSVTGRTDDYAVVFSEFRTHPLFGAGLGSNPPYSTRFLDNQWLQALVQGGAVGVVALAILFAGALAAGVGGVRLAATDRERAESLAYLAAMAAIFVSSFTFDLYAFNQAKYVFFVIFGLAWAAVAERAARAQQRSAPISTVVT